MIEIARALETVLAHGGSKVVLMHGVQSFPTNFDRAHIRRLHILRHTFDGLVGYADHTDAEDDMADIIDLVAVGMGACIIEKHIIEDRSTKGIDHQSALNPAEIAIFVQRLRNASRALGPHRLMTFTEHDYKYRQFQKKTIVAAHDLVAGHRLTRADVAYLRVDSKSELSPMDYGLLDGKTLGATSPPIPSSH